MGPKTPLLLDEIQPILCAFAVRGQALTPLQQGTINSNYRLDTPGGPLFLRVNEGKVERDARFEAELIWHLGSRGLATPQLWRTRRGEPYALLRRPDGGPGKPVMLMQWAEGFQLREEEIGEAEAEEVGTALARLHRAGADFPRRREGIYTLPHIAARIQQLYREPRVPDGTVEFLGREAARLQGARRGDLPRGLGHNDLFPDNVLWQGRRHRRLRWILDLEQAATLPYVYDVAVALLSFCAPVEESPEERLGPLRRGPARALVRGYQALRPLSPPERAGLYEELRFAALRFTTTRLTDVHLREGGGARPGAAGHSKDYRDFLRRLEALQGTSAQALEAGLF